MNTNKESVVIANFRIYIAISFFVWLSSAIADAQDGLSDVSNRERRDRHQILKLEQEVKQLQSTNASLLSDAGIYKKALIAKQASIDDILAANSKMISQMLESENSEIRMLGLDHISELLESVAPFRLNEVLKSEITKLIIEMTESADSDVRKSAIRLMQRLDLEWSFANGYRKIGSGFWHPTLPFRSSDSITNEILMERVDGHYDDCALREVLDGIRLEKKIDFIFRPEIDLNQTVSFELKNVHLIEMLDKIASYYDRVVIIENGQAIAVDKESDRAKLELTYNVRLLVEGGFKIEDLLDLVKNKMDQDDPVERIGNFSMVVKTNKSNHRKISQVLGLVTARDGRKIFIDER